jgi:hypothetical protein
VQFQSSGEGGNSHAFPWLSSATPGRKASAAREIVQPDWSFERQGLRRAESAALRAHHEGDTVSRRRVLPQYPLLAKGRCLPLFNNLALLRWLDIGKPHQ